MASHDGTLRAVRFDVLSPITRTLLLAAAASLARPVHADPLVSTPVVPSATTRPHLSAARAARAPVIDGRLDDELWSAVPTSEAFTQKFPNEGRPPEERTSLRVAYDEDALYVGIDCEQRRAPINQRLTRRDRAVESDSVTVSIDTRRDGTSGFEFNVNAAGVLIDSIRFNDTEVSTDWDENWDARTALTPTGWSAELRIPLRILRFSAAPMQSWGFQVRRYVSHRHETDEWAFIPRNRGGEVSQYGHLDDLHDLKAGHALELSPFVKGRVRRRDVQGGQLASGADLTGSAGLDLKWHPSQELTLDAAVLPDFAEVEADQVILNLTNLETNFPERRRFFLEGIDTFSLYNWQLLYTRRIGRAAPAPARRAQETLVDLPEPAPIYGAAKLTGRLGESWEVGALSALTGRNDVQVQQPDGTRLRRLADPLSAFNVVRIKRAVGDSGHLGLLATSVVHADPVGDHPVVADDPLSPAPYALCPDGKQVSPGQRCSNNAHVLGIDWRWRSPSRDYATLGQAVVSVLDQGPPRIMPDGTVIKPGALGAGLDTAVNKNGGEHWLWNLWANVTGRRLETNDVGYQDRGNVFGSGGFLGFRTLRPWAHTLETFTRLELQDVYNMDLLRLQRSLLLSSHAQLASFWSVELGVSGFSSHFDDRELGDGAALERARGGSVALAVESNPNAWVAVRLESEAQSLANGGSLRGQLAVTLHALPQLDLELIPQVLYAHGEPRFVSQAANGDPVFGRLDARSAGAVLRATYTFTPRLTLQAYGQLFLASRHYDDFSTFNRGFLGPRPAIRLAELHYGAAPPAGNPDTREGALNANVVLRWEFRAGSLLYLVYTRSQAPELTLMPGQVGRLDLHAVRRGPAADVLLLKLSFWWG
jgi:hypothetical protein